MGFFVTDRSVRDSLVKLFLLSCSICTFRAQELGLSTIKDDTAPMLPSPNIAAELQVPNLSRSGVQIRAWIKNEMKVDRVEIRCYALKEGVSVIDYDYVTLKPREEHRWIAEQVDLSPDRMICIMFWRSSYLIHDIYMADHQDPRHSNWDVDEGGLNRYEEGSGSILIQKWIAQKLI